MTARTTFEASVKTATAAKVASDLADATLAQETINQSGVNVGYNLQTGSYSALKTAVDNARKTALSNGLLREQTKQAALMVARDLLRDSGDRAPF
jgi:hypothetical protein